MATSNDTGIAEDKSYYRLGNKATVFWDENQPENKKLLPGQVMELVNTNKVQDAKLSRGIIEVGEKEFHAYQESEKKRQHELQSNLSPEQKAVQVGTIEAQQILAQAEQMKADAEKANAEADAKVKAANETLKAAEETKGAKK
jgi:hypothetical protein